MTFIVRMPPVIACLVCTVAPLAAQQPPDVAALVAKLTKGTAEEKQAAADSLASFGPQAASAVGPLATALASDDVQLRLRAARTLGDVGPGAGAAVPALAKLVDGDADAAVRAQAADSLGEIGGDAARSAVPALAKAVVDKDATVRRAAVAALAAIRPDPETMIPLMTKVLEDADPAVIMPALHTLAEEKRGLPVLIGALKQPKARYWACLGISEFGPDAAPAVPALIEVLKTDKEPEVRLQATLALAEVGPAAKAAVPALVAALQTEPAIHYGAAYALGKIGAREATPALEASLAKNEDEFLRLIDACSLAQLNPGNKTLENQAVKLLTVGLKSENAFVRRAAVEGLSDLKAPPEVVAPALIAALGDANPHVIANAADALAGLGEESVPRVAAGLDDPKLRDLAVGVLARMGPKAKAAIPQLTKAAQSGDTPEFRREAILALAGMGPDALAALSLLEKAIDDKEMPVRYAAIYALGKIGPGAAKAAPRIRKNLESKDEFEQVASAWALVKILPNDAQVKAMAVPHLIKALSDPRDAIRMEAVVALGEIGAAARPAAAAVKPLLSDSNPAVAAAAQAALKEIGS